MTNAPIPDPIRAVALLDEPQRRRIYDFVASRLESVSRDEVALALGLSRELAAFHLERLAKGGLLATEFRRLSGRSGPGAGRPAKLYRRTGREVSVSLPARRYEQAADVFADALLSLEGTTGAVAAADMARARGTAIGAESGGRRDASASDTVRVAALLDVLAGAGYEPAVEPSSGDIFLRNCPYDDLAKRHRDLTCGTNVAWVEGVVEGLGLTGVRVELAPEPGRCCAVFHTRSDELVEP